MIRFGRIVGTTLATGLLLAALGGCQKQEGPAERAGKEVDKATEAVGQQIEKAGEKIQDAAQTDKQ